MPSTIKLTDGSSIHTDEAPAALVERCNAARADGMLAHVDRRDQGDTWFNPHHILTITEVPAPSGRVAAIVGGPGL